MGQIAGIVDSVGSAIGGIAGSRAKEKGAEGAAAAQSAAAQRQIDLLERMYEDAMVKSLPYERAGLTALDKLAGLTTGSPLQPRFYSPEGRLLTSNPMEQYNKLMNLKVGDTPDAEMIKFFEGYLGKGGKIQPWTNAKSLEEYKRAAQAALPQIQRATAESGVQPIQPVTLPQSETPIIAQSPSQPTAQASNQPMTVQQLQTQLPAPLAGMQNNTPMNPLANLQQEAMAGQPSQLPVSGLQPSYVGQPYGQPINVGQQFAPFFASPDYNFRLQQGIEAIQRQGAATGTSYSGQQLKALMDYGQNTASQEYANYYNRLSELAGMGQVQTQQAANLGQNYGVNQGQAYQNLGQAQASGIAAKANIRGQMYSDLGNLFGQAMGRFGGV